MPEGEVEMTPGHKTNREPLEAGKGKKTEVFGSNAALPACFTLLNSGTIR